MIFSIVGTDDGGKLTTLDIEDNMIIPRILIPDIGTVAMDRHVAMSIFVEVARAGSFSAAARNLNVSTTAVSRHVADLERMLGVTLLRRTTRHVSPTEAGKRYLPRGGGLFGGIERVKARI